MVHIPMQSGNSSLPACPEGRRAHGGSAQDLYGGSRGDAAFSLFMRFLNSNRLTYEELEPSVTRTKQMIGPVSNRLFCRSSRRILSHFRTPLPKPRPRRFLIGTQNTSRKLLTRRKQITSQFLIGTKIALLGPAQPFFRALPSHAARRDTLQRKSRANFKL